MPRIAESCIASCASNVNYTGGGTSYLVQTPSGVLYCVYIDVNSDLAFKKSTDGGLTWSGSTVIFTGTAITMAVWYDRWSNIAAGLIHCAYTDSGAADTLYRTINTESSDALSTQTTIFAGASTAGGGMLTITRAVGGNVYCRTCIDAGVEGGFFRLPNANVPNGAWDAARTINEALATTDMMILQPDFDAADTQDIFGIFWDASANGVSRQVYDDSANSWAESAIIADGSATDTAASSSNMHFAAAPDIAGTRSIVVIWTAVDTANADLRCFDVQGGSITETSTNVVLNSTDDQGLCGITIDVDGNWWVFYGGKSDGSETFSTAINFYYKVSKDGGATWGAETLLTTLGARSCPHVRHLPVLLKRAPLPPPFFYLNLTTTPNEPMVICAYDVPKARSLVGV